MRSGDIDGATALLEDECRRTQEQGLIRSFVSFSILLAVARWEEGAHDEAMAAFKAALAPSIFEGVGCEFLIHGFYALNQNSHPARDVSGT